MVQPARASSLSAGHRIEEEQKRQAREAEESELKRREQRRKEKARKAAQRAKLSFLGGDDEQEQEEEEQEQQEAGEQQAAGSVQALALLCGACGVLLRHVGALVLAIMQASWVMHARGWTEPCTGNTMHMRIPAQASAANGKQLGLLRPDMCGHSVRARSRGASPRTVQAALC